MVLAVLLLVLFLCGQGIPLHHAVLAHAPLASMVFVLAALAVSTRFYERLEKGLDWVFRLPRFRFNAGLFVVSVLAYGLVAWFVFNGIPRLDDGMAALFQARLFARGRITMPLPEDPGFFKVFGVLGAEEGLDHWCGMYPPGWPLLLTPGVWLGVPWLVNPILGGLLVVTISELGRNYYGERVGRVAALLAIPSPFVAVLSGLHLSHIATALSLGLCLLSLRQLWSTTRWIWGGAAGLLWGLAFLCRPLDAVILGAIFALGFLTPPERLSRCWRGIVAGLVMALLAVGVQLAFQQVITGDWQTPGHEIGMGPRGKFGFVKLDEVRTHTPAIALRYTFLRLRALNDNLLGWPVPALLIVMLPFVLGRARAQEYLLLLPMPVLLLVFACYWYYEEYFPGRYISAAMPLLFVLAARGLFVLKEAAGQRAILSRIPAFLAVSGTLFLAVSTPYHFQRYDQSFGDVEEVLPRVVRDYGITNALVFMDSVGREKGEWDTLNNYYATGFMRNDLDLQGDVLYLRNSRKQNIRMVKRHPGRAAYLYRYHRKFEKALLYRLVVEGDGLKMIPVKPTTSDLLDVRKVTRDP